jgi:GntR family transcriptional regulator
VSSGGRSYLEGLRQTQFETEVDIVERGVRRPPRAIAEALETSEALLHIVRVRRQRRTGEPLMVTDVWLPAQLTDTLTESALHRAPLYELLSDAGVVADRVRHEITAEIAGPRNAELLDTAIGAALLRVNRLVFVADTPHHQLSVLMSPNRSRVLLNQSVDELDATFGLTIAHDVRRDSR